SGSALPVPGSPFVSPRGQEFAPPGKNASGDGDWVLLLQLLDKLGERTELKRELLGQKLLVTSVRTGDTEIFIADPVTGDLTNVSRSPNSEDRYPCWSPDGKRIAFTSDRGGGPINLYVMDAGGGGVQRLLASPGVCYMPSWGPAEDGERI